jgi:hypothetical protein
MEIRLDPEATSMMRFVRIGELVVEQYPVRESFIGHGLHLDKDILVVELRTTGRKTVTKVLTKSRRSLPT